MSTEGPLLYSSKDLLQRQIDTTNDNLRRARYDYFERHPESDLLVPRLGVFTSDPHFDKGTKFYINGLVNQADEFGCYLDIVGYDPNVSLDELVGMIKSPKNRIFDGGVLTLPLPGHLEETPSELFENRRLTIDAIPKILDVDGMRPDSPYKRPTPHGIRQIMNDIVETEQFGDYFSSGLRISVVGLGQVGLYLCALFEKDNLEVYRMPQDNINEKEIKRSNVVVCTARGVGVITPEHINKNECVLLMNAGKKEVHKGARQRASIYVSDSDIGQMAIAQIYANTIQSHIQTRLNV